MGVREPLTGAVRSVIAGLLLAGVFSFIHVHTAGAIAAIALLTVGIGLLIAVFGPTWFLVGRPLYRRVRPNA